jgi:outer membrane immunogenic protein
MRNWTIAAFVAVSAVAFTQIASAADMPVKAAGAPMVAPAYNWTGFYAGLNAGAVIGHASTQTDSVFSPVGYFALSSIGAIDQFGNQHPRDLGFTGGIQFGYNWQLNNNVVLGLETDFGYMGVRASSSSMGIYPCCAPTSFTISPTAKTDWLWTVRPRLGVIGPYNTLLYVTGGVAVTQVKGDFLFNDTFATANESASISKTQVGWAVGLGAEYAWTGPWSLKAEYLHVDFGSVSTTSTNLTAFGPPVIPFPTNVFTHTIRMYDDIVRVGLNYRFH